jgi:hypothetical protein
VVIASAVTISDADDDDASSATLTIATTASAGSYAACDGTRDYLNLASDYATPAPVTGTWSAATCTLTLLPSTGTAVAYTDLATAIGQVKYFNADLKNPTNFVLTTAGKKRSISLVVTDNKSNGNTAASAASTATTGLVTITTVDGECLIVRVSNVFAHVVMGAYFLQMHLQSIGLNSILQFLPVLHRQLILFASALWTTLTTSSVKSPLLTTPLILPPLPSTYLSPSQPQAQAVNLLEVQL